MGSGVPRLDPGRVDVWWAASDLVNAELRELGAVLDPIERARADRFRFRRHRDHFVAAHVFMRLVLGHYLGIKPASVRLRTGPYGKPALDMPGASRGPHFSLTHCDGIAVLAISPNRAVGVDVERIRPGFDYAPIVSTLFGPAERAWLHAHEPGARELAFFCAWTRKEALAKATGMGLTDSPGPAAHALRAGRWAVFPIRPADGYAGAVAADGAAWRPHCHEWRLDSMTEQAA